MSSGKGLVLAQWNPHIYVGVPTPLPALPLEVSFFLKKGGGGGWLRDFEKIKESKKGDFQLFWIWPPKI